MERLILSSINNQASSISVNALLIKRIEFPHVIEEARKAGLLDEHSLLKDSDSIKRLAGIKQLFDNGTKTAYLIILTHWPDENEQVILDFILNRLAKN